MTKSIDILAFSPHPDDAELGCAGSLILASGQGLRTAVADLSEGEHASKGTLPQKREEKKKAARIMGLCHRFSLRLPDTAIGTDRDHLLVLVELIRKTRPSPKRRSYWPL